MKPQVERDAQSPHAQHVLNTEMDRRILAELRQREDDPRWHRVRALLLESPTDLRDVRDLGIGQWQELMAELRTLGVVRETLEP